jgi:uncharacterized membrane protein
MLSLVGAAEVCRRVAQCSSGFGSLMSLFFVFHLFMLPFLLFWSRICDVMSCHCFCFLLFLLTLYIHRVASLSTHPEVLQ